MTEFEDDPEYRMFEEYVDHSGKAKATAKSYRTTYRKLRNLLGKCIQDTAQSTCISCVMASTENINSAQALLNIAIVCREQIFQMPVNELVAQRTKNKETVAETLKMNNKYIVLPSISEFDAYLESLWENNSYRDYIVNYLIRHHYVRNLDLIFEVVESKKETKANECMNYLWLDRKKQQVVYIRNNYKTKGTYGQKTSVIDNERFLTAVKKTHKSGNAWPITPDESKIGYYIKRISFNELGEGLCLKIIVNEYRGDINMLKRISESRGTDLNTLLTSYNITYTDQENETRDVL